MMNREKGMNGMKEFKEFLLKQNALALAIGVIIGAAIGKVVSSIVADLLMPVISLAMPGGSWRETQIVLSRSVDAAGKEVVNAIRVGSFVGSVIDFVIIAFVIYLIAKAFIKPAPAPSTKACPACLETIPAAATKCRACASAV
jgi:large conductance mechanosensitive channel